LIKIFTDGSSTGKVGPGGWGYVVIDSGIKVHEAYGGEDNTTNNRMEIQAVIEALRWMDDNYRFDHCATLYSDSQYVVNGINDWYDGWVIKMRLGLKKVKNWDQWQTLGPLAKQFWDLRIEWVRGHNGNEYNEYVDKLAKVGKKEIQDAKM